MIVIVVTLYSCDDNDLVDQTVKHKSELNTHMIHRYKHAFISRIANIKCNKTHDSNEMS
jgi:hypothetical protein